MRVGSATQVFAQVGMDGHPGPFMDSLEEDYEFTSRVGGNVKVAIHRLSVPAHDLKVLNKTQCEEYLSGFLGTGEVVDKAVGFRYDMHTPRKGDEYEVTPLVTILAHFKNRAVQVFTIPVGEPDSE